MNTGPAFLDTSTTPKPGRKYFSIQEANRALPYVTRVVEDMNISYRQAMSIRQRAEHVSPEDDQEDLRQAYELCMDRLNELIDELHMVGVEFKDFEMGLVDFPALHEGREVCLCWKRGEAQIVAWHEMDSGYAGRQNITSLR